MGGRPRLLRLLLLLALTPSLLATVPARAALTGPAQILEPSGEAVLSPVGVGDDVSFPDCGLRLPLTAAFAVVGVNGGVASNLNPCLGRELAWAVYRTTGLSPEPPASLYLNTGDPGSTYLGEPVPDWPRSGSGPFGSCLPSVWSPHLQAPGSTSAACAFEYGLQRVQQDSDWVGSVAGRLGLPRRIADYPIWLDVETSNTWQGVTALNVADLEGMVYELGQLGADRVGVYASPSEWQEITGAAPGQALPGLSPLPDWELGTGSLALAESACRLPSLTGGPILLAQYLPGGLDADYAC